MELVTLLSSLQSAADSPDQVNEDERASILAACEKLKASLESPLEAVQKVAFAPLQSIVLRLAIDIKLFDAALAVSSQHGGEVSVGELTEKVDADPLLVARIVRFLAAMGIFQEVAEGRFKPTKQASIYASSSPVSEAVVHITHQNEVIFSLPNYFEANKYQSPIDAYDGPFQYARNTKLHCFDWIATQPRIQQAFNVTMTMFRNRQSLRWFDIFPVEEKLRVKDISNSTPLVVDIGGGVGHDLIAFKKAHPDLPGKLIVEDLPVVIEDIKDLPDGIQAIKHDFFAPQPVKGAKAYYLSNVLHDWPDKQARIILGSIRGAMKPGFSTLLINESLLGETNVSLYSASVDLLMMANFSALDRTQRQFATLLDECGFDLVDVWRAKEDVPGVGAVLEAVLKE